MEIAEYMARPKKPYTYETWQQVALCWHQLNICTDITGWPATFIRWFALSMVMKFPTNGMNILKCGKFKREYHLAGLRDNHGQTNLSQQTWRCHPWKNIQVLCAKLMFPSLTIKTSLLKKLTKLASTRIWRSKLTGYGMWKPRSSW